MQTTVQYNTDTHSVTTYPIDKRTRSAYRTTSGHGVRSRGGAGGRPPPDFGGKFFNIICPPPDFVGFCSEIFNSIIKFVELRE